MLFVHAARRAGVGRGAMDGGGGGQMVQLKNWDEGSLCWLFLSLNRKSELNYGVSCSAALADSRQSCFIDSSKNCTLPSLSFHTAPGQVH
jgi:hypothetical protein